MSQTNVRLQSVVCGIIYGYANTPWNKTFQVSAVLTHFWLR